MPDGICFSPYRAFVLWLIIFLRNLRKGVDNVATMWYNKEGGKESRFAKRKKRGKQNEVH